MASLAELQERLQADIMQRSGHTLSDIKAPRGKDKAKRLAVYQNAYKLRLTEILGNTHERLWTYLGDEQFYRMSDRYFDACPSNHANARFVSTRLPQFLATDERYSGQPVLAEIAAIEEALEDVFDAPDAPLATMEDLASLPPDQIAGLTIVFAPSIRLLALNTNALDIFQALKDEGEPPAPAMATEPLPLLAWRQELRSRYRAISTEEDMLLREGMAGKPFSTLCEIASVMDDPENAAGRVAGYLTGWINGGMVSELRA